MLFTFWVYSRSNYFHCFASSISVLVFLLGSEASCSPRGVTSPGSVPFFYDWEGAEASGVVDCMADGAAVGGYYSSAGVLGFECIGVVSVEVADACPGLIIFNKGAICIYVECWCYGVAP